MVEINKNIKENNKLNTSNIFDEFEVDDDVKEELEALSIKKNGIYYITKIGNILKYINFGLIFLIMILYSYIFIQTSDNDFVNNKEYLNPICSILNGSGSFNIGDKCSGLFISNKIINEKIKVKELEYLKEIIPILKNYYEIESVKNSKEALFLINKSDTKNDPIKILNDFDILKNKFIPILKSKIKCSSIDIKGNNLKIKCSSYSTTWYNDIPGIEGQKGVNTISGTSITLASSFINFISNSNKFDVINKQKIFEKQPYFGEGQYIYKTDFEMILEYNNNDLTL